MTNSESTSSLFGAMAFIFVIAFWALVVGVAIWLRAKLRRSAQPIRNKNLILGIVAIVLVSILAAWILFEGPREGVPIIAMILIIGLIVGGSIKINQVLHEERNKRERIEAEKKGLRRHPQNVTSTLSATPFNRIDHLFVVTNVEIPPHWKEDYLNQLISMCRRLGAYKDLMTNSSKVMALVGGEIDCTDKMRVFTVLFISGKFQNPRQSIECMTFGDFDNRSGIRGCVVAQFAYPI